MFNPEGKWSGSADQEENWSGSADQKGKWFGSSDQDGKWSGFENFSHFNMPAKLMFKSCKIDKQSL